MSAIVAANRIEDVLAGCRRDGLLREHEGLALLDALGITTPRHCVLPPDADPDAAWLSTLPGARVVVKVVAADIAHKSDVGGVLVVDTSAAAAACATLRERFGARLEAILVEECVEYDREPGGELLLGARWTDDFGPVVTLGVGGVHAEFFATAGGARTAIASACAPPSDWAAALEAGCPAVRLLTEPRRGRPARLDRAVLADTVARLAAFAATHVGAPLREFEVNPLVVAGGRLVALDAMGTLTTAPRPQPPARPIEKLRALFAPRSVAVVGVSEKMNPGHIIVRNLLREGFDAARITIVKPGTETLDGCRCVPSLDALPAPVDLCVLAISAPQVPEALATIARGGLAESVVVIPGGLEEKSGSDAVVAAMRDALAAARARPDRGPVICGGNSLGVRSQPGRIDTLFIPDDKLPRSAQPSPVALISNSGAFAVARAGKLAGGTPRYIVTAGNQMDCTIGDYLAYCAADDAVRVFAVYVEGFRPLDGARCAAVVREIRASGRAVVFYRAGRTAAGATASSSHTAAIAGDAAVCRALLDAAGALVAESLEEFEDLVQLAVRLDARAVRGLRAGAVSNAGFECVGIADALGPLVLAEWSETTRARFSDVLAAARIGDIVDVHDPLDLTPMAGDAVYEDIARAALADDGVDVAILGCVPLTAALKTLAHDAADGDGVAARLARVIAETRKPCIAIVDAGPLFDTFARQLEAGDVPVFRTADRAVRALGRYLTWRLGSA